MFDVRVVDGRVGGPLLRQLSGDDVLEPLLRQHEVSWHNSQANRLEYIRID
jgi:hypothetical protein